MNWHHKKKSFQYSGLYNGEVNVTFAILSSTKVLDILAL